MSPEVITTTWPGVTMTDDDGDGDGWFEYKLSGVSCAEVIFSTNGNEQTSDLNIYGDGWYNDGWVNTLEIVC